MGPEDLAHVLQPLKRPSHPDLLIGLDTADDGAVYRLGTDTALIQTVDFFPPIVDDPYTFGAIAAANALSDVYAMGGEPFLALAIAGFPRDLPHEIIRQIFRGGADKADEAGVIVAGGHTVVDEEPKYGLVVTGRARPDSLLRKDGARPGDVLYLTKPIGTGVITTAHKNDAGQAAHLDAAVTWMLRLNGAAARLLRMMSVQAATGRHRLRLARSRARDGRRRRRPFRGSSRRRAPTGRRLRLRRRGLAARWTGTQPRLSDRAGRRW